MSQITVGRVLILVVMDNSLVLKLTEHLRVSV